ncbi:hypothetical protein [Kitasatospora herbaricolor]|uniref:Uncharacterized protein n=1 Tax=Kitasatospora herbaricolor TaxID=68217 RepID=A0ABZ1W111_9ACTN|nr:hypothetical protein [Kitasatospora herbaricolor]
MTPEVTPGERSAGAFAHPALFHRGRTEYAAAVGGFVRTAGPGWPAAGGRGLWMIHQLCDLVGTRATGAGLTPRLNVRMSPGIP